jgi:Tol biopolymer transport system component
LTRKIKNASPALLPALILLTVFLSCGKSDVVQAPQGTGLSGKIIFAVWSGEPELLSGVWMIDVGSPNPLLAQLLPGILEVRVSPDEQTLVFSATSPQGSLDIFSASIDGSHKTNLTNRLGISESWADWSHDGNQVIFNAYYLREKDSGAAAICVVNQDGTGLRAITDTLHSTSVALRPRWSPDCQYIACIRERSAHPERVYSLLILSSEGAEQKDFGEASHAFMPQWSVDGKRVAYGTLESGKVILSVANWSSGVVEKPSIAGGNLYPTSIAWSPDGSLFCLGQRQGDPDWGIYRVLFDNGISPEQIADGFSATTSIVLSPDAKYLGLFGRRKTDAFSLYVMRPDGSDLRLLRTLSSGRNAQISEGFYNQWIH